MKKELTGKHILNINGRSFEKGVVVVFDKGSWGKLPKWVKALFSTPKVKEVFVVDEPSVEESEDKPDKKTNNNDIRAYMDLNNIEYGSDDTKAEMLAKIEAAEAG